jgi:hypothetical protein
VLSPGPLPSWQDPFSRLIGTKGGRRRGPLCHGVYTEAAPLWSGQGGWR